MNPDLSLRPRLLQAVTDTLRAVFLDRQFADRVLASSLREGPEWRDDERAFIAETTYEVIRRYRLLTELMGREPRSASDWIRLVGVLLALEGRDLPPWREFEGLTRQLITRRLTPLRPIRPVRESVPDWLDALGARELGNRWPATLAALNKPAAPVLRANRLKTDPPALRQALQQEGIQTQPLGDDALLVTERRRLFTTKAFQDGWFEMQDFASQQVAPFLQPAPGLTVVDACAGAGGKTLHLAALMQNKGRLLALDPDPHKLNDLQQRARRAGATNITPRPITGTKVIKRLDGKADRLLLDVPCSGLGVLRRNPEIRWRLTPAQLRQLRDTQAYILSYYPRMLKPGGLLVYATCSVLPSESEEQVQTFLRDQGSAFELLSEKRYWPQEDESDGFYMALLKKNEI